MDENHFDRLSDDLLRLIVNKVLDANSLCRCLSVSKRFASIVPQTDAVSLAISRVNESDDRKLNSETAMDFLKILVYKFIAKPFQFLHRMILPNSSTSFYSDDETSYFSPDVILKRFDEIESLHIRLPSHDGELGADGGESILKWKAECGSEIESCVILAATSFRKSKQCCSDFDSKQFIEHVERENSDSILNSDAILNSDYLKLRIVWTISCLIAASARHYLLKQIVKDRPKLRRVEITDANKQGRLCMNEEQILDMRNSKDSETTSLERSRVPALSMKLWYVPALELPVAGWVMEGATLVVIRAVDGMKRERNDVDLVQGAFDGEEEEKALSEAVKEMMKKTKTTSYALEMD